jgi:hypothetical protein
MGRKRDTVNLAGLKNEKKIIWLIQMLLMDGEDLKQ